jgi:hypothetical protein
MLVMGGRPTPDMMKQRRNMAHGIVMVAQKPYEGVKELY